MTHKEEITRLALRLVEVVNDSRINYESGQAALSIASILFTNQENINKITDSEAFLQKR